MAADERIRVEVAYATPAAQLILEVSLPAGSTVGDAIEASGIAARFPDIDPRARVGVWGKLSTREAVLAPGDRVEIYRPLIADPKTVRRERAKASKDRES